ncbi:MAG: LemA family protein [Alphaproteobacteria bacterium]|nr:LemA family protein [Alphaproteobacteria bacterium]
MPLHYGLIGIAVLLGFLMVIYNRMVRFKNFVEEGWSGIDVQLKRRFVLLPNLIESVKGYAKHEKTTFEDIVKARQMPSQKNLQETAQNENMISSTLKSIFALSEAYPDLKANENFKLLQKQLTEIENTLQLARRYYNGTIRAYNIARETFPANLICGVLGFKEKEYFEIENALERQNVKVSLSCD